MHDFIKSWRFKALVAAAVVLVAFMLRAAYTGGLGTVASKTLGVLVSPLQKVSGMISDSATGFFQKYLQAGKTQEENEELRKENRELREKLVDYETIKQQNEQYKEFLSIKERNNDFEFEPASVIGRDPNARFYSFTIDVGSLDGVEVRDPVITSDGLVGMVYEVGPTYAKVHTILDVSLDVGAFNPRTKDTGIVTGTVELAQNGNCRMEYLDRDSQAQEGDIIVTSGISGIFPKDLTIGTIRSIAPEDHGMSLYAVIEPAADIREIKDVFVIKSFAGQGSEIVSQQSQDSADSSSGQDSSSQEGGGES